MRLFRLGLVGTILVIFLPACGDTSKEETTMPTKPVDNSQFESMRTEMLKSMPKNIQPKAPAK